MVLKAHSRIVHKLGIFIYFMAGVTVSLRLSNPSFFGTATLNIYTNNFIISKNLIYLRTWNIMNKGGMSVQLE